MSNFKQFLFLAAVFLLNNILTCESQSCSAYSSSTTCAANSQCSWIYRSGAYQCACASAVPEDVYFLMDISGSIGEEGWIEDTDFVSEMITTGLSNNSRVGIITFGTTVTIKYNLSQTQHPRSILTSLVTSMPYTGGSTYTKDGVSVSINQFKKWATKGYPRLLFIITDGKPNPSSTQTPCPLYSTLVAQNITVFIIGVTSSFSSADVSCIVTNPSTNIVEASSFSNLASVRDYADNVLCPTSIQLTLTEVRIQNTSSSNSAIFIELYNSGSVTVDLKSNPLKFTGIVSGILNSSIHANISVGQYVVLYQATTSPNCTLCTCSMNSKGRCKNALYIPCNGKNCTFNSKYNGKTANNTNWGVAIQNTNGQAVILNVSYSKSTWPSVATGYTFELQSLLDDCTVGTNWAQSCWPSGTPGQGPLTSCTACKSSTCQQNGDTGAKCSGNTCNCTETKDYYLYSGTCYLTTNVTSCTTVLHKDSGGNSVDISWTAPTILAGHEYEISYPFNGATGSGTVSSNQAFFVYYDSTVTVSSTTPQVRVVVFDNTSTLTLSGTKVVYGSWVPCPIKTSSPTKAPTPEPTYAIPTIGCCNATITGTTGVIVKWCTPTFNYPTTPKNASSYKIYITCSGTNSTGYSTSRIYSNTISGCTVTSSSLTSIKVAPVVDLLTGSENDALMKQYAKSCTILTSAPTKTPTTGPTKPPTKKPTTGPTKPPTQRPTYPYYKVNSCNVIIGKGDSTINVTYTFSNPSNTSNPATYILYDKNTGTTSSFLGNPTTFSISGVLITDTSRFYVYPQFLAYPGGGYIGLACCNATCTITTVAPTRTPTGIPTHFPTGIPTHFPTALPSGLPTSQPTPFPTYGQVDVGQCKVVVAAGDSSFTISFYEPSVWSFPISSANYRIDNGNTFITYIQTGTAGDFIDKVIPYSINPADQIYVTVYYSISHAQGQSIQCNITTPAPTKAPTHGPTTPAPTFSSPTISFDSTQFGGSTCSYTTGNSYATCTVTAGQKNSFRVIRNPAGFSYGVSYQWVIVDSARRRMLYNASLFRGETNGTNLINGSVGNEFDLLYYYYAGPSNTSKLPSFTFTIDLTNCYVNDSTYLANPAYPCSVVYPSQIIVTATYSYGKLTTNNVLGNLPTWIWYAIAAGVLIIPLLSYLGYRYYKKRKLAEMLTEQKKEELRDAEQLDEAGNFGGIGDAVAFNPLATGGTHDIATGGQYIDSQLDHQKQNFETAHVDVDVINFKQDFGQVQAVKR